MVKNLAVSPKQQWTKRRFSLLEMIAVVIIVLMMMGAVVPLLDIGGAAGVDGSARVVASQMRMARSYAIAQKKYVAVLMPSAGAGDKGGADEVNYRASSIRACILDGAPSYNATTQNREATFDEYLPPSSTSLNQYDNVRAIIFTPTGSTAPAAQGGSPGTTNTTIRIVEAVLSNTTLTEKYSGDNALQFLVYNLTGRVSFTAL
jgi:Tfp pilus assembly protein FimT